MGAVLLEDVGGDLGLVVEAGVLEEVEEGSGGAGFGVGGAVDEVGDAGVEDGAGAHGAGFEGDGEGAAEEAPGAEFLGGCADGDDLGVGCGIFVAFAAVLAGGEDGVVGGEDDGADGDFAGGGGESGLVEGEADEVLGGDGGGHGGSCSDFVGRGNAVATDFTDRHGQREWMGWLGDRSAVSLYFL